MPNINTTPMPTEPGANAVSELSDQLRADVRLLTTLLGQVLKEGGSSGLFDDVEALRQATIAAHRDSSPEAFARATEIAESFPVERADEVARAFTVYFHLVNLAEEFQRVRMLREGHPEVEGATDTIPKAMAQLREEIGEEAARRRLENLRFHPVFTAHPTEARRRAVSTSIRRIARLLEEQVVVGADQVAGRRVHRRLLEEIDTLWRTAPLRSTKPGPEDEVRSLMSIFDETLYTTLPRVYRYVDDALQPESAGRQEPLVRPFIRRNLGWRRPRRQPVRHPIGDQASGGHRLRSRVAWPGAHRHHDRPRPDARFRRNPTVARPRDAVAEPGRGR